MLPQADGLRGSLGGAIFFGLSRFSARRDPQVHTPPAKSGMLQEGSPWTSGRF